MFDEEYSPTEVEITLQKELEKAQIILAYVLFVGGPVDVPKEVLANGLPANATIAVDDNQEQDCLSISLEVLEK